MNLDKFLKSDLGVNTKELYNTSSKLSNSVFVDLGVRTGVSSEIMLIDSGTNNNKVFGVDVDFSMLSQEVNQHNNYTKILGDSVTVGKRWDEKVGLLFIDTFHIKEQVLMELYYWYKHVVEGGFIVLHDTNWPIGKHDMFGGITWPRVEEAIFTFFNVNSLNYEDEFIKISNYPESWGMTIIEIKKKYDYSLNIPNWGEIFDSRNKLISLFWNETNSRNIEIELLLKYEV